MFSSMIQKLLSSSGQANAMQRAVQMNNHINSINSQWMPVHKTENMQQTPKTELSNFDKVLGASAQTKFGSLVSNPTVRVDAKLYTEKANSVAQKNDNDYSSKNKIKELISKISQKHGVDEKLVNALIKQESGFNPNAKSRVGAMGLMQLMPATAKGLGVTNPMDPEQNVEGGIKYLRSMLDKYNGNIILALAAYNAGPGAVDKYDGVPPYKETQNYVKSILSNYL